MLLNTNETLSPPTESEIRTGGLVLLVRTLASGDIVESWELPYNAVSEALFGAKNGSEVRSCRISWGVVSRSVLDVSGSSLAVEWSSLRKPYDLAYGDLG